MAEKQVSLRVDEQELNMLEELARRTVRTKSDMMRYLIRKEYLLVMLARADKASEAVTAVVEEGEKEVS